MLHLNVKYKFDLSFATHIPCADSGQKAQPEPGLSAAISQKLGCETPSLHCAAELGFAERVKH